MTLVLVRVMALTLLRDRGALALMLLLPGTIYLLFAAIFSTTSGGEIALRVGLAAQPPAPETESAMAGALAGEVRRFDDVQALRLSVAEGSLDAGLVLRGALTDMGTPPLAILADPGKGMAAAMLERQLRSALAEAAPEAMLARQVAAFSAIVGPLTTAQRVRLDATDAKRTVEGDGLTVIQPVGGEDQADPAVTYYAGAIAVMFLLFSGASSAASLIDERNSGILDRFAAGPGGIDVVVLGKALFLTAQGIVQTAIVFTAASLVHGVPVLAHPLQWAAVTLLVAAAAAGFSLALVSVCTTRAQAQTLATFVVLVASAVGGSMVPRFLMPGWLRDLGTVTPHAWAIDLYYGLLTRAEPIRSQPGPLAALAAMALGGTGMALVLSRRRMLL